MCIFSNGWPSWPGATGDKGGGQMRHRICTFPVTETIGGPAPPTPPRDICKPEKPGTRLLQGAGLEQLDFQAAMRDRRADIAEVQPGGAGQPLVGGDDADAPALEPRRHHRAKAAVKRKEQLAIADPRAVGRVHDDKPRRTIGRRKIGDGLMREARALRNAGTLRVLHRVRDRTGVAIEAVEGQSGPVRARVSLRSCPHAPASKHARFSNAKDRSRPGARPLAISAASITKLPEPHIGSTTGSVPS